MVELQFGSRYDDEYNDWRWLDTNTHAIDKVQMNDPTP
jgi:hypothetical protein